jgi:hypothetical protein
LSTIDEDREWILSPNGGGKLIADAAKDALMIADAIDRDGAVVEGGQHVVDHHGIRRVMMRAVKDGMLHEALITIPQDRPFGTIAQEAGAMAAILRKAAGARVDWRNRHKPDRHEACRVLAASGLHEMLHRDTTVSITRPTAMCRGRAALLEVEDGLDPFTDVPVRIRMDTGRLVLTANKPTTVKGMPSTSVVLDSESSTQRIEGMDMVDVLRTMVAVGASA